MASKKSRWGKKTQENATEEKRQSRPVLDVRKHVHSLPDATCVQLENYYTIEECEKYLDILNKEIEWRRQEITVNKLDGRVIEAIEPRLTTFMSDPGIVYEYSGRDNHGIPWTDAVWKIKEKAEQAIVECGLPPVTFNCVQMNRYEGPRHSLGMHADNEPDLLKGAPIASVSFGATREFEIMRRDDESKKWSLTLADGCFLVMGGAMQTHYLHGVPPGGAQNLRFNLTFRVCVPRKERKAATRVAALESGPPGAAADQATSKVASGYNAAQPGNQTSKAGEHYSTKAGQLPASKHVRSRRQPPTSQ